MKIYHIDKKHNLIFRFVGLFFAAVAVAIFMVKPSRFSNPVLNVLVYLFVLMIAMLHMVRSDTCYLKIDDYEMHYYDGLLHHYNVQLDYIEKVEWSSEISTRIYLKTGSRRKQIIKIPNIFSVEDKHDFLSMLHHARKLIQISEVVSPLAAKISNTQSGATANE